jgi:hypothetical protein
MLCQRKASPQGERWTSTGMEELLSPLVLGLRAAAMHPDAKVADMVEMAYEHRDGT